MTVCIAAACDNGAKIVAATDGRLSMGDVTGDTIPGKLLWYGPWQFMYAGIPAQFELITEEMRLAVANDPEAFSRARIQQTVRTAYRKFAARFSSCDSLDPFDMTVEEFKKSGLKSFGESFHSEILRRISQKAGLINEQILVTGWGISPHAAMIYEIGPSGDYLHTAAGFASIGSGAQMAQTMLLLMGQARHCTLAETIFNVACAKFSAEKSSGLDVGPTTTIYISEKGDCPDQLKGMFLSFEDIGKLRLLWEAHLRPRIPDEARSTINGIAARANNGQITAHDMVERLNAAQRLTAKHNTAASSEDHP